MSTVKLNIQLFTEDAPTTQWSSGITKSAVESALETFNKTIEDAIAAIENYEAIDTAFKAGWSGKDCEVYLEKFHEHAKDVIAKINEYKAAVGKEANIFISQWETFQSGLIS